MLLTLYITHTLYNSIHIGVLATWLRDVPFSIIYFTTYSQTKQYLCNNNTNNSNNTILPFIAGAIAGTLAAAVTTPLDVIKTRVHASAIRADKGLFWHNEYSLVYNTIQQLIHKEGYNALWKGIIPRCMIISPLFGITMKLYETLQEKFH